MKVRLIKTFEIDCAHHLPCFPQGHKCRGLHGHTMRVDVVVEGDMPPGQDYLVDFGDIKQIVEPVRQELDHKLLNEIEGLSVPTVENLAHWLWRRLKSELPALKMLRIHETPTNICEYEGE